MIRHSGAGTGCRAVFQRFRKAREFRVASARHPKDDDRATWFGAKQCENGSLSEKAFSDIAPVKSPARQRSQFADGRIRKHVAYCLLCSIIGPSNAALPFPRFPKPHCPAAIVFSTAVPLRI